MSLRNWNEMKRKKLNEGHIGRRKIRRKRGQRGIK